MTGVHAMLNATGSRYLRSLALILGNAFGHKFTAQQEGGLYLLFVIIRGGIWLAVQRVAGRRESICLSWFGVNLTRQTIWTIGALMLCWTRVALAADADFREFPHVASLTYFEADAKPHHIQETEQAYGHRVGSVLPQLSEVPRHYEDALLYPAPAELPPEYSFHSYHLAHGKSSFSVERMPLHWSVGEGEASLSLEYQALRGSSYGYYSNGATLEAQLRNTLVDLDEYGLAVVGAALGRDIAQHAHGTRSLQLATLGAAFTLASWATIDAAIAARHTWEHGAGTRPPVSHVNQRPDASLRQEHGSGSGGPGASVGALSPAVQRQLSLGSSFTLLLRDSHQRYREGSSFGLRSGGLVARLGKIGSLRLTAYRSREIYAERVYAAHLSLPIGRTRDTRSAQKEGYWQGNRGSFHGFE